jgi:hypothetical protein
MTPCFNPVMKTAAGEAAVLLRGGGGGLLPISAGCSGA